MNVPEKSGSAVQNPPGSDGSTGHTESTESIGPNSPNGSSDGNEPTAVGLGKTELASDGMTAAELLQQAQRHAQSGRFDEMLACLNELQVGGPAPSVDTLLSVGALLASFGFLSGASQAYEEAIKRAPNDLRARINLANVLRDASRHEVARHIYDDLIRVLPDHPVIRRNALTGLEYDPGVSDAERLEQVKAWGQWAVKRVGGARPRPPLITLDGRCLRIGYVSADFCQHTVGLFVKAVLAAHNKSRVQVFAYSAGLVKDWVTHQIRAATEFRDVAGLDDSQLAKLIQDDAIDVLVDLSGHTAGSRLTVFALRPAPVLVSWLGYFASTGLPYMDAVLLDQWHAPEGSQAQFVEPVVNLPRGRFCYEPVAWAPVDVSPPPCVKNGFITFGCFNNTAKFNEQVFIVWAEILASVAESRLILKWRTFNDRAYCEQVTSWFVNHGIAAERLELRGPSFHGDLLKEYADIDICLDPFPFTGGLTSCEALWMGVPVITWPQSRVVSRQTFAFLSAAGLPELAAHDAQGYVQLATHLAHDIDRLVELRGTLREKMRNSVLMDVPGFVTALENTLIDIYLRTQGT